MTSPPNNKATFKQPSQIHNHNCQMRERRFKDKNLREVEIKTWQFQSQKENNRNGQDKNNLSATLQNEIK